MEGQIKAKFSEGPWMAAARPSSVVGWPIVGPMGRLIASISWMTMDQAIALGNTKEAWEDFNAQCKANADLIAAGPDMYRAIRDFMPSNIGVGNGNVPDDTFVTIDVTMGELRALKAALAKANGE